MRTVRVIVRGQVQGVGYRWFTRREASSRGVDGWVRNRHDGSVEALLRGAEDAVDTVLAAMAAGPAHSRIDELTTSDADAEPDAAGFEIRPTA